MIELDEDHALYQTSDSPEQHEDYREELAALCHEQWAGWHEYLLSKAHKNPDGSVTIPKQFADRWERQMCTAYAELSEAEKNSDRAEADKFLALR